MALEQLDHVRVNDLRIKAAKGNPPSRLLHMAPSMNWPQSNRTR